MMNSPTPSSRADGHGVRKRRNGDERCRAREVNMPAYSGYMCIYMYIYMVLGCHALR